MKTVQQVYHFTVWSYNIKFIRRWGVRFLNHKSVIGSRKQAFWEAQSLKQPIGSLKTNHYTIQYREAFNRQNYLPSSTSLLPNRQLVLLSLFSLPVKLQTLSHTMQGQAFSLNMRALGEKRISISISFLFLYPPGLNEHQIFIIGLWVVV